MGVVNRAGAVELLHLAFAFYDGIKLYIKCRRFDVDLGIHRKVRLYGEKRPKYSKSSFHFLDFLDYYATPYAEKLTPFLKRN